MPNEGSRFLSQSLVPCKAVLGHDVAMCELTVVNMRASSLFMLPRLKVLILVVISVVVLGWGFSLVQRWRFPYGYRAACLPMVTMALYTYGHDHSGRLPAGGGSPLSSLQLVYPEYVPYAGHLAGLSGDVAGTVRALEAGQRLSDSLSSWVYQEGFRIDDDPPVAVLWDRKDGISGNASRMEPGSRIVGFSDGSMRYVSAKDWQQFEQEQSALRAQVLIKRGQAVR